MILFKNLLYYQVQYVKLFNLLLNSKYGDSSLYNYL